MDSTQDALSSPDRAGEVERLIREQVEWVEKSYRPERREYVEVVIPFDVACGFVAALPTTPPAADADAGEVERLREALAAVDDYWAASRAHACALPRLSEGTRMALEAATCRRDAARAALAPRDHGEAGK